MEYNMFWTIVTIVVTIIFGICFAVFVSVLIDIRNEVTNMRKSVIHKRLIRRKYANKQKS